MDFSRLRRNDFDSKRDFEEGLLDILKPLEPLYQNSPAGYLNLGYSGAVYDRRRQKIEAFLRPLWGLGAYFSESNLETNWKNLYLKGIIAGTDPMSKNYWGKVQNYDQLIVEMASIATMILLSKEETWDRLTETEQKNLHSWLIQVNEKRIPKNNWVMFRVLVNTAMMKVGMQYSEEQLIADFNLIETFYLGNGWYCDGKETQVDYYVSFAIHYYSLIYYASMKDSDVKRCGIIEERVVKFAQTFKYWFDSRGEAIPFGRSLTYRFAQSAFWSALVVANIEALPWGEIKGLISRNLCTWFNHDIFTVDGRLSIGYHYENLVMSEGYNAPGSTYWALKTFIVLAVDKEHPFWQTKSIELTFENDTCLIPEARMLLKYSNGGSELVAYPAGQFLGTQNHGAAKYSKFAYSTKHGFSVPMSNYAYEEGGFDSTLALSEDDKYYRSKSETVDFKVLDDRVVHLWEPFHDVVVKSTIIPIEAGHIRVHEIHTGRNLYVRDAGFSTKYEGEGFKGHFKSGVSYNSVSIQNISGYTEKDLVLNSPNTNIFYPLTVMPVLKVQLKPGRHLLISLINHVRPNSEEFAKVTDNEISFCLHKKKIIVPLD